MDVVRETQFVVEYEWVLGHVTYAKYLVIAQRFATKQTLRLIRGMRELTQRCGVGGK